MSIATEAFLMEDDFGSAFGDCNDISEDVDDCNYYYYEDDDEEDVYDTYDYNVSVRL